MTRHRPRALTALAVAALILAGPLAGPASAHGGRPPGHGEHGRTTFTVIGDLPYGTDELAALPGRIDTINASRPAFTVHLGDIKSGSQRCDTAYFETIRQEFGRFRAPFVYTPGDNEWTDCHRVNNGAYDPLERLRVIRALFFAQPGTTLGQRPMAVASQAARGLPENVSFRRAGVDFATLHVVGSNDDLQPWTGIGNTVATHRQVREERARMAGAVDQVRQAVATATEKHDRAIVLFTQADMFDPNITPAPTDISAFKPLVQALVDAAESFDGEVYLFNGDSHIYNSDQPLAPGSVWLSRYGVTGSTTNLTRVTVDGSDLAGKDYLQVTVARPGTTPTLSWERVPYTG
jgi:hypothetical protein